MKVYANAFKMEATGQISVNDFLIELSRTAIHEFMHSQRHRVLAIEQSGLKFVGCILSRKEVETYLTLETDPQGRYFAKNRRMEGGPSLDFSFFIISKKTGNGIYTQYLGSGGLTQFGNMLRVRHQEVLRTAANLALEEAGEREELTEKKRRQIAQAYRGSLSLTPVTTNPDFARELKRLARVSSFEFQTVTIQQRWFRPIADDIKYVRHRFTFDASDKNASRVRKAIQELVANEEVESGTVRGRNTSDQEDYVTIHPENYCLSSYKFSEISQDEITLSDFSSQKAIKKLLALASSHPDLY